MGALLVALSPFIIGSAIVPAQRIIRPIMITVSLVFGLLFFYQGASGLLSL